MSKKLSNFVFIAVISLVLTNCANRGNPTGGEKDVTPPVITKSVPENYSTNFNAQEIKIYFDEYVKIIDLQKQLIISPPMDYEPEITPLGAASKYITIKIHDTLRPNTTYAFNFGESIVDNNESNPYPYYRYVFSTGSYIDSLKVNGSVKNALKRETDEFVSVSLYEVDSTFTDSIIYKHKPKYITNTLDSTTTFQLENLKAGKYLLVALKDENSNYTFQQKKDKIGFHKAFITVPTDSIYELTLFKETTDFKTTRPMLVSGNKIAFGYEGDAKDMKLDLLSQVPEEFTSLITKHPQKDTLNYWYQPKLEVDSLVFRVANKNYVDTLTVRIKDQIKDSLIIKPIEARTLRLTDDFELQASTPFVNIDHSKINILDKDSVPVTFTSSLDSYKNRYKLKFDKTEDNIYRLEMLPGAFTEFFGTQNDSLNFNVRTKSLEDYGDLRISLQNPVYPLIVQLVNQKGDVEMEKYSTSMAPIDFISITPGKYYLRVIFDTNGNKIYDPGTYLKKRQSERVSYYPDLIDVRAFSEQVIELILR